MTDEVLHTVEFIEREEYIEEEYPSSLYSVSARADIPLPRVGEVITYLWFEEGGERVDKVDIHESGQSSSDVEYERSQEYKVLDLDHNYHRNRQTGSDGTLTVDRIEVGTTVIVEAYEDNE